MHTSPLAGAGRLKGLIGAGDIKAGGFICHIRTTASHRVRAAAPAPAVSANTMTDCSDGAVRKSRWRSIMLQLIDYISHICCIVLKSVGSDCTLFTTLIHCDFTLLMCRSTITVRQFRISRLQILSGSGASEPGLFLSGKLWRGGTNNPPHCFGGGGDPGCAQL